MSILPEFKFRTGVAGEQNLNLPSGSRAEPDKHTDNGGEEPLVLSCHGNLGKR